MTSGQEAAHSNEGPKGLLAIPWLYRAFGWAIGGPAVGARIVADYIRPDAGCRILDLGCGPGGLPEFLPDVVGEYCGLDVNASYIEAARARWKTRPTCTFIAGDIGSAEPPRRGHYDVVTAVALMHHLSDADARRACALAHEALVPGGRLITWDCVFVERQHPVARWLIERDRGRAVRTEDGYRSLASEYFPHVATEILHDTLRVPYTICAMTSTKSVR